MIDGLQREQFPRLTLDFDGSVLSTKSHAEGSAIDENGSFFETRAKPKRSTAWKFQKLDTIRHQIIQRAGRFIWPKGKLTLTMSSNRAVKKDLLHFIDVLQKAV